RKSMSRHLRDERRLKLLRIILPASGLVVLMNMVLAALDGFDLRYFDLLLFNLAVILILSTCILYFIVSPGFGMVGAGRNTGWIFWMAVTGAALTALSGLNSVEVHLLRKRSQPMELIMRDFRITTSGETKILFPSRD